MKYVFQFYYQQHWRDKKIDEKKKKNMFSYKFV